MDADTQRIYDTLREVAQNGDITHYSDIAPLAGLNMESPEDRNRMSDILDDISRAEHKTGGPLLSAVVILKCENIPGDGFFTLADDLKLYTGGEKVLFWVKELRRVHDHWHPTKNPRM